MGLTRLAAQKGAKFFAEQKISRATGVLSLMARVSVEDCLNYVENRFALVAVASHRARKLMDGDEPLVRARNKEMVLALREIAEGLVLPVAPKETAGDAPAPSSTEQ